MLALIAGNGRELTSGDLDSFYSRHVSLFSTRGHLRDTVAILLRDGPDFSIAAWGQSEQALSSSR